MHFNRRILVTTMGAGGLPRWHTFLTTRASVVEDVAGKSGRLPIIRLSGPRSGLRHFMTLF